MENNDEYFKNKYYKYKLKYLQLKGGAVNFALREYEPRVPERSYKEVDQMLIPVIKTILARKNVLELIYGEEKINNNKKIKWEEFEGQDVIVNFDVVDESINDRINIMLGYYEGHYKKSKTNDCFELKSIKDMFHHEDYTDRCGIVPSLGRARADFNANLIYIIVLIYFGFELDKSKYKDDKKYSELREKFEFLNAFKIYPPDELQDKLNKVKTYFRENTPKETKKTKKRNWETFTTKFKH
tara:strand:- start:1234 stop:1956 length:723 start_codon:yes stop_codon:yes gene_type:complete